MRIWDWEYYKEERALTGHGWDVKTVEWHPYKSLIVSGSKDNLIKLWDPRTGNSLSTLYGHKNTVMKVRREGKRNTSMLILVLCSVGVGLDASCWLCYFSTACVGVDRGIVFDARMVFRVRFVGVILLWSVAVCNP